MLSIHPVHRLPPDFVAQPQFQLDYEATVPYVAGIVAEWPPTVSYIDKEDPQPDNPDRPAAKRRLYYRTGKLGVRIATEDDVTRRGPLTDSSIPCAEYQCVEDGRDRRVWLLLSGELEED